MLFTVSDNWKIRRDPDITQRSGAVAGNDETARTDWSDRDGWFVL
jgi:hypothetical protein